jgi:hypothetical protein
MIFDVDARDFEPLTPRFDQLCECFQAMQRPFGRGCRQHSFLRRNIESIGFVAAIRSGLYNKTSFTAHDRYARLARDPGRQPVDRGVHAGI